MRQIRRPYFMLIVGTLCIGGLAAELALSHPGSPCRPRTDTNCETADALTAASALREP